MKTSELILVGTFALGVWLVVQAMPTRTPPSLAERVAPYLVSGQAPFSIAQSVAPRTVFPQGLVSLAHVLGVHLARMTGGENTIRRRLDLLGRGQSHEEFRLEQVMWGLAGATTALAIVAVRGIAAGDLLASADLIALGGVGGVLARDQALTRSVHRRTERLRTELPTVVEMLAMAVGAGGHRQAAGSADGSTGEDVGAARKLQRAVPESENAAGAVAVSCSSNPDVATMQGQDIHLSLDGTVVVNGRVYISTEKRLLWILNAGREKQVLHRSRLHSEAITPVVDQDMLLFPTQYDLFAIRL